MDALKKKLEVLTNIPKKKYPYPMTAAQEVGWDSDVLFNAHKPKYSFNRKLCAEVAYVDAYVTAMHKSPLVNVKSTVEAPKK